MDSKAIQDNINELESADTTVDNVKELAMLYIVRNNLSNKVSTVTESELRDILPAYKRYCAIKRRYQLHEVTEDAVIKEMKCLCEEIKQFISSLYSHTDFYKERTVLFNMLEGLHFN